MKCVNHPERLAEYTCAGCNRPFCSECIEIINNEPFCKGCAQEKVGKEVKKEDAYKKLKRKIPIIGRLTRSGKVAFALGVAFFLLSIFTSYLGPFCLYTSIGIICISIIVWIYRDSKARAGRCSGLIWWCFLANPWIGWLFYLVGRPRGNLAPCSNCGERKVVTDIICPHCGASGKVVCPKCSKELGEQEIKVSFVTGSKVCKYCGAKVEFVGKKPKEKIKELEEEIKRLKKQEESGIEVIHIKEKKPSG